MKFTNYGVVLLALMGSVANTQAATPLTGSLKTIKENNVIVLGNRESSVPYSYYDNGQKVIGYSQDIAMRIVDEIRKEIDAPNLQVRMMPITAQNRIALVQNGTINFECGGTTNNAERRKQVEFSNTISITETRLLTKKSSGIKSFNDINGKTIAVTAGTTSERYLRKRIADNKLNVAIVAAVDHAQGFMMVQQGRAAAFFMDSDVLSAELAKANKSDEYIVTGEPQTFEAIACMLPKNDPALKAIVDRTIARMQTSGDAYKLYQKWFMSPIPPQNINLNLPLSQKLKAVFQSPNDQSLDD
ncbi:MULTISPECIES: glutamate/aspartate ABC transporter substrate-binding protein [Pandoraea]|uniref:Glutamate/aspartate import solute-binding protein n=1 Tax=Pandoraea cepalis TaxID=2508294 RepID=A0A5E4RGK6_9BURK|nr:MULTISPECIES: glutamate/aspartate ABC transporter substrate-binding protein [Pandoraea]QBC30087.1 glutamate/aspartate ABC transporter substrate-binding protein [Pandoraea sp. XY-2]VVD61088.1 Glutamate/aspartate import solute-binding protein [Pandoraea cepalis]